EFNGITEIVATNGMVVEVGALDPIPAPDLVGLADLVADVGEPWESVLVRVEHDPLQVVGLPGFEVLIDDGSATGVIDDYLYSLIVDGAAEFPNISLGATITAVQGPGNVSSGAFKIPPVFAADLEGYAESDNVYLDINDLVPGDLVITEIMYDPGPCDDNYCEWIEIYNATGEHLDLSGLRVQDAIAATGTVAALVLEPDGYAWLGRGPMANWGYTEPADAYYWPNPALNDNTDKVVILNGVEMLDQPHTSVDEASAGKSLRLDPAMIDVLANDDPDNWCYSTVDFGDGDLGSPGAANEAACNMNP